RRIRMFLMAKIHPWAERASIMAIVALCGALPLLALVARDDLGRLALNHAAMSTPDEHAYLLMAKALANGHGISTIRLGGGESVYPPGLPLALAAWGKTFGFSIFSMHACVAAIQSAAVFMLFFLLRRIFTLWKWPRPARPAVLVTAVLASNFYAIYTAAFV